jgi:hypothetical protein
MSEKFEAVYEKSSETVKDTLLYTNDEEYRSIVPEKFKV